MQRSGRIICSFFQQHSAHTCGLAVHRPAAAGGCGSPRPKPPLLVCCTPITRSCSSPATHLRGRLVVEGATGTPQRVGNLNALITRGGGGLHHRRGANGARHNAALVAQVATSKQKHKASQGHARSGRVWRCHHRRMHTARTNAHILQCTLLQFWQVIVLCSTKGERRTHKMA